jgi:hypothetical protein
MARRWSLVASGSHASDETFGVPHVVGRHVQDGPARGREPVQPVAVGQEGLPPAMPEPVVLDRDLPLGVGE